MCLWRNEASWNKSELVEHSCTWAVAILGNWNREETPSQNPYLFRGGVFGPQIKAHYRLNPIEQEYHLRMGSDSLKLGQKGKFLPKAFDVLGMPSGDFGQRVRSRGKNAASPSEAVRGRQNTPTPLLQKWRWWKNFKSSIKKKQSQVVSYVIMFP